MKIPHDTGRKSGFTLIETLMVVAVIAIFAGGAIVMINSAQQSAKQAKLNKDVTTINAAISTFVANGGDLTGVATADDVLLRIKSRAKDDQEDQLVGVRAGFLDPRIKPVGQSAAQGASSAPRAVWDATKKRFIVKTSGAAGIREFVIDETQADKEDPEYERKLVLEYSKKGNDKWVWEYADHNTAGNSGPGNLPPAGGTPTTPGPFGNPTALQLDPPIVSPPGGNYAMVDYDGLQATVSNPNPVGVSELFYSVVPGVWERYTGPIPIDPGTDLETQAVTIDPDDWSDSVTTLDEYRTNPEKLDIDAQFAQSRYNYESLGGSPMTPPSTSPTLADPGDVTLVNSADIPTRFQNDTVFEIRWTFDGSDPLTSATALIGDPFSGGFPGQDIPFGIDDWGSGSTMDVKVVGKSLNPNIVTDSDVMSYPLGIQRTQLPAPIVEVDNFASQITLKHDPANSTIPLGARIYYMDDGSDPGIASDGEPVTGTLYGGSPISPSATATVVARTYAPVSYMQWFIPSPSASGTVAVVGSDELYVGGEFSAGGGFRNVARLAPDGSLDSAFNPGAGATPGSVVGAVQSQGGAGVLAGGNFETMNGVVRYGLARLAFDGSVDTGFDADLQ